MPIWPVTIFILVAAFALELGLWALYLSRSSDAYKIYAMRSKDYAKMLAVVVPNSLLSGGVVVATIHFAQPWIVHAGEAGVVDVIASPQAPAWADSCLPDFTCREVDGVLFAWRPASGEDPGESWMVHRRADEVVAVHVTGRPMPAKAQAALGGSGFFLLSSDLTDPTYAPNAPSLQTTRARFEAAQRLPDVSGHLPAG